MHTNFYKDPVIRFDITKLQSALKEVDSKVEDNHHLAKEILMQSV